MPSAAGPQHDSVPFPRQPRLQKPQPNYEFRVISLPRTTPRTQVREILSHEAEYGHWELARSVLYIGGARKLWLRRRVQRVESTL